MTISRWRRALDEVRSYTRNIKTRINEIYNIVMFNTAVLVGRSWKNNRSFKRRSGIKDDGNEEEIGKVCVLHCISSSVPWISVFF